MLKQNPETWLVLKRTARFGDTDAAGVMHFHQLLRWCHEAWEESLETYGIQSNEIFPSSQLGEDIHPVGLPVVHCQASFRGPIYTGDELIVIIKPMQLNPNSFEITTTFNMQGKTLAIGLIRHMAIHPDTRQRIEMPDKIQKWLEASYVNHGPTPT